MFTGVLLACQMVQKRKFIHVKNSNIVKLHVDLSQLFWLLYKAYRLVGIKIRTEYIKCIPGKLFVQISGPSRQHLASVVLSDTKPLRDIVYHHNGWATNNNWQYRPGLSMKYHIQLLTETHPFVVLSCITAMIARNYFLRVYRWNAHQNSFTAHIILIFIIQFLKYNTYSFS